MISVDSRLESTEPTPDAWWRLYSDPRLDELVREALQANRNLAAAEANLMASRAVVSAARAARYPSTDVGFSGVYGRDPVTSEIFLLTGRSPETLWLFEDVIQASYEVDLFGRVHRAIEVANANAESVAALRDEVRVVVAAETARAYAGICTYGEQINVAKHSLDVVGQEAQITTHRFQAGAGSELDVTRAQSLVSQVHATLPQLNGARQSALFDLAALLGRTPANAPRDTETCTTPPQLAVLIPVGDGRSLLQRRPDVRQAERQLAAATASIGVATADLYPTIRLSGFYGGAATEVSQLGTNPAQVWGLGPSISWAFPNQTGVRARVRQAKATTAAALASFDAVVLNALKEAEQALSIYRATLDQRESLLEAQAKIHRSFEIARAGYVAGSLSQLDLLTTEQSLVALDAQVAASDAALVQGQIAVFKALGGGWRVGDTSAQSR